MESIIKTHTPAVFCVPPGEVAMFFYVTLFLFITPLPLIWTAEICLPEVQQCVLHSHVSLCGLRKNVLDLPRAMNGNILPGKTSVLFLNQI